MPTFACSECSFSKEVPAKAIGKKAKCPKCNAVNVIEDADLKEDNAETLDNMISESDYSENSAGAAEAVTDVASDLPPQSGNIADNDDGAKYEEEVTEKPAAPESAIETVAEDPAATETVDEDAPVEPAPAAPVDSSVSQSHSPKLSAGMMSGFGVAGLLLLAGVGLFSFQLVNLAVICFGLGMVTFIALAVVYTFLGSSH